MRLGIGTLRGGGLGRVEARVETGVKGGRTGSRNLQERRAFLASGGKLGLDGQLGCRKFGFLSRAPAMSAFLV